MSSEPTASRTYFVRHGESEANVAHRFANAAHGYPLTALGRTQAGVLAERLAAELSGTPPTSIHTSPLPRARETAQILAARLGSPLQPADTALAEFDVGEFEGTDDDANWQAYDVLVRDWLLGGHLDRRLPGGESCRDIDQRFSPFFRALVEGSEPGAVHVLVSHGGLIRAVVLLVAENVDGSFAYEHGVDNASWVLLRATADGVRCECWGEHVLPG
jgi:broad specificity phosphatase PhoE